MNQVTVLNAPDLLKLETKKKTKSQTTLCCAFFRQRQGPSWNGSPGCQRSGTAQLDGWRGLSWFCLRSFLVVVFLLRGEFLRVMRTSGVFFLILSLTKRPLVGMI